jgi:hypothetical protein
MLKMDNPSLSLVHQPLIMDHRLEFSVAKTVVDDCFAWYRVPGASRRGGECRNACAFQRCPAGRAYVDLTGLDLLIFGGLREGECRFELVMSILTEG